MSARQIPDGRFFLAGSGSMVRVGINGRCIVLIVILFVESHFVEACGVKFVLVELGRAVEIVVKIG